MGVDGLPARIRRLARPDAPPDPELLADLSAEDRVPVLREAGRLLASVPAERLTAAGQSLRPLRVAVTATFTADDVIPLLRVALLLAGIAPHLHLSGFDRLAVELADPGSELGEFRPDVTLCLLHDQSFLPGDWDPADLPRLREDLRQRVALLERGIAGFSERTASTVLLHTVPLTPTEQRSVISYRGKALLGRIWRELNGALLDLAERLPQVHTLDLEMLLASVSADARDERLYRFAGMAWSPSVEHRYAREAAKFCRAAAGLARKCLVLDVDNTLWGGVVGDDGPAGLQLGPLYPGNCYVDVQRRAKSLERQGVLLALCSKNEQAVVDEVFAHHPDVELGPQDFAAQTVNWEPKDRNLQQIAHELSLGLDSLVFADDSSFECGLVRSALPQVAVVQLGGDPADHVTKLLSPGYFDVLETTATDRGRTEMYRARAERLRFAESFSSVAEYLRELELRVRVRRADAFALPRLVQLSLRTNQFNMAGRAHSEARTRQMVATPEHLVLAFEVSDRFGREGIVGGLWISKHLDHWLVENLVMSCRVLGRGVELAVLQNGADRAAAQGAARLEADFRPTERNRPAARCYPEAGFTKVEEAAGVIRYALPLIPRPELAPAWIIIDGEEELTNA